MENRNEKALKIIEQQYANFIDLTDKWDFFRGLADYVKTVQELTQTKPFIEALEAQRKLAETSVEVLNTTAMKELTAVAGKMQKVADDIAKHYAPLQTVAEDVAKQYVPIRTRTRFSYLSLTHSRKKKRRRYCGLKSD
jgi:uncharacterized protein YPO0396